ncbi:MAG: hypothetical protein ONB48_04095 [candidate division KSB1 bacterium]|nr:hypothetical protein [candidate division KSB1 bacterium]MDZ7274508.1 hypothetical protein [candidate division KSB1 bacterium]MDZ7284831.1 hypothetical protein [candidate division KSB1 bacterium]MDZ7297749.1 hypothetical protein [candidate division KSB1 bacterium]MDZ7307576.1 hypothetical protein [candidate division KSB1 bacterium]
MTKCNKKVQPPAAAGRRALLPAVAAAVLLFAGSARSQAESAVTIESRVSKARLTIGDTVRYRVRVRRPPDVEMRWPGPAANLGGFEIRGYQTPQTRREGGVVIEEAAYTISTFDTGRFEIPPLTLQFRQPPDTGWQTLRTEKLDLHVASLRPSEAGDIREIKAPWELPRDWRQVIVLSVIVAAVLLLAAAGYSWWRRRQGRSLLPARVTPPRPAHEEALAALAELRRSDLPARGEIKLFYSILSEIVRRYLEGRYQVGALEMTTCEVLEHCKRLDAAPQACDLLREILEQSDLVKFAKFIPPAEQHERLLAAAETFVHLTMPLPPAVETAAGEAAAGKLQPAPAEAA